MQTVVITGGTGLIGRALIQQLLANRYSVTILTRDSKAGNRKSNPNVRYAEWDVNTGKLNTSVFEHADHVIHLAGAGVADKRWTEKRKQEILDSRTRSSELLVKAIREAGSKVKTVVSASAIGWYGPDRGGKPFTEDADAFEDFLGTTCKAWEESIEPVTALGKRLVKLRTGIVLSNEGGALREFKKPLAAGVASILGTGKQIISWIHITDLCRMYHTALENEYMHGVFNAVAPIPVKNKELVIQMAKSGGKRYLPVHVPEWTLKLMMGEMSIEVLKSVTVDAGKISASGFRFLYPTIDAAMNELMKSYKSSV
jgi:uncharacterized protein (TIGR01777 family)